MGKAHESDRLPPLSSWPRDHAPRDEIGDFLDGVYANDASSAPRRSTALILEFVDHLLNSGRFDTCAAVLNEVDVARLSPSSMVSFLGSTLPAKKEIGSARSRFFDRVKDQLATTRTPEQLRQLLDKYQ